MEKISYSYYDSLINRNIFRLLRSKEEIISAYFLYGYSFYSLARSSFDLVKSTTYLSLIAKKDLDAFDICKIISKDPRYEALKPVLTNVYRICHKPNVRAAIAYSKTYRDPTFNLNVIFDYRDTNRWASKFSFAKSAYGTNRLTLLNSVSFPSIDDKFFYAKYDLNSLDLG